MNEVKVSRSKSILAINQIRFHCMCILERVEEFEKQKMINDEDYEDIFFYINQHISGLAAWHECNIYY